MWGNIYEHIVHRTPGMCVCWIPCSQRWVEIDLTLKFLYVQIAWKQWLLPAEALQYVYCCHSGRALSRHVGSSLSLTWLRHQYTNCTASIGSNHCFYWNIQELTFTTLSCRFESINRVYIYNYKIHHLSFSKNNVVVQIMLMNEIK